MNKDLEDALHKALERPIDDGDHPWLPDMDNVEVFEFVRLASPFAVKYLLNTLSMERCARVSFQGDLDRAEKAAKAHDAMIDELVASERAIDAIKTDGELWAAFLSSASFVHSTIRRRQLRVTS